MEAKKVLKKILVMAGGTATAFHICEEIKRIKDMETLLIVTDINDKHLVQSSIFADVFEKVLPIMDVGYYEQMLSIFDKFDVDVIVPLIDYDIKIFHCGNKDISQRKILSTAPRIETFERLSNKRELSCFLNELDIKTPMNYDLSMINANEQYFFKPRVGFGSRNTGVISGAEVLSRGMENDFVYQEICAGPEITADVFCCGNLLKVISRERIETKAGVCTKARIFFNEDIENTLRKIANTIELPVICCVQFMKNSYGDYCLTDFNLRAGAGSALSSAMGFRHIAAAVRVWFGMQFDVNTLISIPLEEKFVIRHYTEVVMK